MNTAHPRIPASQAALSGNLYRSAIRKLAPATATNTMQAPGVRRSHGETMSAAVAVKSASTRRAPGHLFCNSSQRTYNGETNKNCLMSIEQNANKNHQQN